MATAITYLYQDSSGIRYIGQTIKPMAVRHRCHRAVAKKSQWHFYRWWRQQPSEPQPVIVGIHSSEQAALETERELIALARVLGEPLTNTADGGSAGPTGMVHSAETREKISRALRGRPAWNKGRNVWSDEERKRIGEQTRGRVVSEETRAKMGASRSGERNPLARLDTQKVQEMRVLRDQGMTYRAIAQVMGVNTTTAHRALTGVTWKAAP